MQTNTPAIRDVLPAGAFLPGDDGYDAARISFNGILDRRPAAIVSCASTDDVVAAVRAGRAAGLPIAIRGGGHSVAGHSLPDGALVVSLDRMRTVDVDPARRLAHAGGGALWDDIDAAAFVHGLAVPGGTFGDTGIGGLTLGGGLGWLMPVAGLTCDNLVEAEVVTAEGSVVTAGPDSDADLLWALRGGGGNFGVVTRFTFHLTPVAPMWGGTLVYAASAAREVYARFNDVFAAHPTIGMPTIAIHQDPDVGPSISVILGIVDGSEPTEIVDWLRRDLPITSDDVGPRTYLELQAMAGILPFGLRHYWKGHFLRTLDFDTFERLVEAVSVDDALGEAFILLEGMVGAARIEPEGGAAFGQRAADWNVSALAIWESPDDDDRAIGWARRVNDIVAPLSLTGGGYVNYSPVDETAERVMASYGPERYARLVAVKRRLDPDNVFRFNHNIRPD
ncbi:MAG TPA: FAD-binding oxidoreductase [Candidatus Limnocylindrales bacterium]|nr:FAD-binding oxidoreductase [Candidatus Limnocylindrales bacterium]